MITETTGTAERCATCGRDFSLPYVIRQKGSDHCEDCVTTSWNRHCPAETETADFDVTTAAGRLRTLWNATADPQLAMGPQEVADVETVLAEHAAMAKELAIVAPLDPARKTCRRCTHWFLAHRRDQGCLECPCTAGMVAS